MFPFGADDEDFEFGYILDRNLEVLVIVSSSEYGNSGGDVDSGRSSQPGAPCLRGVVGR